VIRPIVELFLAHKHSRESWDPTQALLGKDRRVFERIALQIPCKMNNQLFGLESEGSTVNLSLGGVGLVAPVSWPEGSQVRVSFDAVALNGLIVYRRDATASNQECRYGIKFQKLGFVDLLKLRKVIKEKL
jgi:PilZ domain-containing protein